MLMRRKLPVSILIAGMLTFIAVLGVGAQQADLDGSANFRDSNAVSDSLVLALTDVPAPPSGSVYEGWLKGGSGALLSTGVLSRSIGGAVNQTYQSPTNANLLATYSQFVITEEPASDPDPATPGTVIWSDTVPAGVFPHIAPLLVIATDAGTQAQVAVDHAALAKDATTLSSQQSHAQHVINAIDGLGDPGDSVGVIAHANAAIALAGVAKSATTDAGVIETADEVIASANNTIAHANAAKATAGRIIAATSSGMAVNLELENLVSSSGRALNGTDEDGDSIVGNDGPEGGAKSGLYTFSQDLGMFVPLAGAPTGPPPTGDALVPLMALLALVAGVVLTAGGGLLVFRRRATA
jgi:hypothetical protein